MKNNNLRFGCLITLSLLTACATPSTSIQPNHSSIDHTVQTSPMTIAEHCMHIATNAIALLNANKGRELTALFQTELHKSLTDDLWNNIYKKEIEPAGQFLEKMEITAIA